MWSQKHLRSILLTIRSHCLLPCLHALLVGYFSVSTGMMWEEFSTALAMAT